MALEHATLLEICNTILDMEGYLPMEEAQFGVRNQMDRPQLQVWKFVNECDARLILKLDEVFTKRSYVFGTIVGQSAYNVDDETDLESITYHSLRCIHGGDLQRMIFLDYHEEYRERYPDLEDLPSGRPTYWTYVVTVGGATQRANQIILTPVPDDEYQFEYWAKVGHRELTAATDRILWPPQYQHVLISAGREMLGTRMGPNMSLEKWAQQAIDSVAQWGSRPSDKPLRAIQRMEGISGGMGDDGGRYHWGW